MIKKKMPTSARGKKTKKARMEEMAKKLRQRAIKAPTPKQVKGKGMSPGMKKAITGSAVGMGGAGLLALARRIKPRGRLNAADMERVKKMMGKKSGGIITPEQMKKLMGMKPFRKPSPPGMKPVLDSKGNPVKNLFQKDNERGRPKKRRPGLRRLAKGLPARRPTK